MEHTQGKIEITEPHCDRGNLIIGSPKDNICEVYLYRNSDEMTLEESKANAEFIVRTWNSHDDLLASCKEAKKALNVCANYLCQQGQQPTPEEVAEAIIKSGQAIAKAEKNLEKIPENS